MWTQHYRVRNKYIYYSPLSYGDRDLTGKTIFTIKYIYTEFKYTRIQHVLRNTLKKN